MCNARLMFFVVLTGSMAITGCSKESPTFTQVGQSIGAVNPGGDTSESPRHDESVAKSIAPPPVVARDVVPAPEAAMARAEVGHDRAPASPASRPQAGILTAGSFDDNLDPFFYRAFVGRTLGWQANQASRFAGQRLVIVVKDQAGNPVGNAHVSLTTNGNSSATGGGLVTRTDGRAVFLNSFDNLPSRSPLSVRVVPPGASAPVVNLLPADTTRWEVTVPGQQGTPPRHLDLALVIDTTGSMGDELSFLKSELRSIVAAVRELHPSVEQRFALIVYRDTGDQYVTRRFDFTQDLDEFSARLEQQQADGGGDTPEAVHEALASAQQLSWRSDHAARVMFLIADAPPHQQFMPDTFRAADRLRRRGVALYPIACSGYDAQTEFVMRSCAMLTGSQFLFLTDDSGVGNAHAAPQVPFHHVQRLDHLMIRMIASELAGKPVPPRKDQIIRTVGKPINE